MVRNLALNFLYRREGTRVETETDAVGLIVALDSAESLKGSSHRVVSLSRVSFPFWIVQTSSTKSIVVSATSSPVQQFQFTEIKGASEIRRIVSSEVSQASDIPAAVSKIEPLIDRVDSNTVELSNVINPILLSHVGKFILASDPNIQPNRVDIRTDSNGALKRTEEFREVSESVKLRIEATEALQSLLKEKFGGQFSILENLITLEKTRWEDRVKQMEERTEQEIAELKKNKDDQLYNLREKQKMDLRVITADFARAANDLEQHFTQISENIRDAKTEIGQKEDDVEGAISIYENLADSVRGSIETSNQPIHAMDAKKEKLAESAAEIRKRYEQERIEAESALETQIEERRKRIEDTKIESEKGLQEQAELKANTSTAIEGSYVAVENKIIKFQEEFLNLMSWTLDSNSVQDLAPLTQLDIHTYIAKYDNDVYKVITPRVLPEVGASSSLGAGQTLGREFDEMLSSSIDEWIKADSSFKDALERACIKGNVFLDPEAENMLSEGLETLNRRRLIQKSDIERYGTLWYKYMGKCPKCSSSLEAGAKFCNNCGLELI